MVTRAAGGTGAGQSCLNVTGTGTTGTFHSVFFACPVAFNSDAARTAFLAGTNNVAEGTSTLANVFVNGANENAVTAYANLAGASAFLQNVTYIGAVKDANDNWWKNWTCSLPSQPACAEAP